MSKHRKHRKHHSKKNTSESDSDGKKNGNFNKFQNNFIKNQNQNQNQIQNQTIAKQSNFEIKSEKIIKLNHLFSEFHLVEKDKNKFNQQIQELFKNK